jgi:hypothetical protein
VADRFSARCQIAPEETRQVERETEKRDFSAIANVWPSKDDIKGNFVKGIEFLTSN